MAEVRSSITTGEMSWGWLTILLSAVALIFGGMTIGFQLAGEQVAVYIFKPLATLTILAIAMIVLRPPTRHYKVMLIFGLGFSLVGDILLMLPQDVFLFGLIAFLVAQIFYIVAFSSVGGFYKSVVGALPFLLYGLVLVIYLWPYLDEMLIPTLIYAVVILVMAWQALGQWRQTGERRALIAFVGTLLFVVSDSALAINRFANPIELAPLLVLGTYYPAQWLIAVSAGSNHP
jgi:uncharacterized membrane protein YhhN